ncbi:hypothetical protein D3C78_677740 [compost metagenome]
MNLPGDFAVAACAVHLLDKIGPGRLHHAGVRTRALQHLQQMVLVVPAKVELAAQRDELAAGQVQRLILPVSQVAEGAQVFVVAEILQGRLKQAAAAGTALGKGAPATGFKTDVVQLRRQHIKVEPVGLAQRAGQQRCTERADALEPGKLQSQRLTR